MKHKISDLLTVIELYAFRVGAVIATIIVVFKLVIFEFDSAIHLVKSLKLFK